MSLRVKTILGIALIEGLMLLTLILMMLDFIRQTNSDRLQNRGHTVAALFAATTEGAVISYDLDALDSFVNEVMEHSDLVYARVVDAQGRELARAGDVSHRMRPGEWVAGMNDVDFDESVADVFDDVYDTRAQIKKGDTLFGQVEVGFSVTSIETAVIRAKTWAGAIASVEMILVATFSFVLGTLLTGRLKGLIGAARRVQEGKYGVELAEHGKDEIAEVVSAFNSMTRSLRRAENSHFQYERELLLLNQNLETRVRERTKELNEAVTELQDANKAIKEAQAMLLQNEKLVSVGMLAAGVAHEINNPVSYVLSNLRTLKDYRQSFEKIFEAQDEVISLAEQPSWNEAQIRQALSRLAACCESEDLNYLREDLEELIDDSIDGGERIREIVASLKEFSHADDADARVYYDINRCIRSSIKMAQPEYRYRAKFETDLADLPEVLCAPGQINQVILNLLVNAAQAMTEMGEITVSSCLLDPGHVQIEVKDSGKGIAADKIPLLFEPFYTDKPVGEGTGMGLAICARIIAEHDGRIDVSSVVGEGSVFTVTLPVGTSATG